MRKKVKGPYLLKNIYKGPEKSEEGREPLGREPSQSRQFKENEYKIQRRQHGKYSKQKQEDKKENKEKR